MVEITLSRYSPAISITWDRPTPSPADKAQPGVGRLARDPIMRLRGLVSLSASGNLGSVTHSFESCLAGAMDPRPLVAPGARPAN